MDTMQQLNAEPAAGAGCTMYVSYEIKPYCEALETFFVDFIPNPT